MFKTTALSLACLLVLGACGDASKPGETASGSASAVANDPLVITVAAEQAQNYQTGTVKTTVVTVMQEHPGRVEANERLVTRIGASVTGRVTDVLAEVGDTVSAGQTLAHVSSPELTTAQLAFLRAAANQSLAERAVDRARQLIQADVIGSAELLRRESELSIAKAELRAANDQLLIMGLPASAVEKLKTQGSLHPQANVTARLPGVVLERKVSQGQVVQPGDQLFTVAELSNVWIVGALPEQAARTVQRGQTVEIIVPAIEQQLSGKVVFVSDTIQPETRTVAIRTQLDNPNRELKPQMLATLRIAGAPKDMAVVPEGAVVRENDRDHVFVQLSPGTYRLTAVELGAAVNKQRPVLKGVNPGETVVVQGAFHLNNDRNQRLLTNAAPAPSAKPAPGSKT
jgi:cobalt-zinc-cadmium efflux system membrane fusion protein